MDEDDTEDKEPMTIGDILRMAAITPSASTNPVREALRWYVALTRRQRRTANRHIAFLVRHECADLPKWEARFVALLGTHATVCTYGPLPEEQP
jgi:hypothetical protein